MNDNGGYYGNGLYSARALRSILGLEADEVERNTCRVCGNPILIMVFRESGYCSINCLKAAS